MVVLVDHDTASSAEIVTGALKDHGRAEVVGTRTYGKGVFQEIQPLPNGGALDFTVGEYFTPNGQNLGARRRTVQGPRRRDQAERVRADTPARTPTRAAGGREDRGRQASVEIS